jgi:glutathione reductase (NADPH)
VLGYERESEGEGELAHAERNSLHVSQGTCVVKGCVPKKVMFNAATLMDTLRDAPGYGVTATLQEFSWQRLKERRDANVARLTGIYAANLAKSNVEHVVGRAVFENPHTVRVGETLYTAPHIVIATGGFPTPLQIPGGEHSISSDGFFELEALPTKVAVVGAGYIAVEIAGILRAMGSEVDLFIRHDEVTYVFDRHAMGSQLTGGPHTDSFCARLTRPSASIL